MERSKKNPMIERYKQYLRLEKSFSANTLDAYCKDLYKLKAYIEAEGKDLLDVIPDDLHHFIAGLHDVGIHPRSQARILSGIRSFYRFLLLEDYIASDPTELIENPRIGVLNIGEEAGKGNELAKGTYDLLKEHCRKRDADFTDAQNMKASIESDWNNHRLTGKQKFYYVMITE